MSARGATLVFCLLCLLFRQAEAGASAATEEIVIGSKKFTESVILGDIAAKLCASTGARTVLRQELGGTRFLWSALLAGEIDVYPEYVGTLRQEILAGEDVSNEEALTRALAARGVGMSEPLGFRDAYALGMRREAAERLGIATISNLVRYPELRFGFSDEFLNRKDGWPALRATYGLSEAQVRGLDHDIAYKGLAAGKIDVVDLYTTDPEIALYDLKLLDDDRGIFSDNEAVLLYRAALPQKAPKALAALLKMQGRIDEAAMIAMNKAVKVERRSEDETASRFVQNTFGIVANARPESLASRLLARTLEHLRLVALSLGPAIVVSIPLGVLAFRRPALGQVILALASVLQTIPSLALLVFMLPLLGVGPAPAIAALFLYSLLPIIRNTASGLQSIPASIRNSAIALGLTATRRLLLVELPLATPAVLAGIKTAAVINVGTATLGALIGAGGYGQPIFTGVRLDDFSLILEGAIPAAALALFVQGGFEYAERRLVPRGLRLPERGTAAVSAAPEPS
jgi:osmoprotectant transport system permease protein